jgi:hypothetical protein
VIVKTYTYKARPKPDRQALLAEVLWYGKTHGLDLTKPDEYRRAVRAICQGDEALMRRYDFWGGTPPEDADLTPAGGARAELLKRVTDYAKANALDLNTTEGWRKALRAVWKKSDSA